MHVALLLEVLRKSCLLRGRLDWGVIAQSGLAISYLPFLASVGMDIKTVIIDPHYEEKHAESVSDEIILELVQTLDGKVMIPEDVNGPYSYFAEDKMELYGKHYKLIWLLEEDQIYIGVINAYRR